MAQIGEVPSRSKRGGSGTGDDDNGSSSSTNPGGETDENGNATNGGSASPPAKHALIGYWHNFANPSGPAFPISQVSDDWDVIDVAFASNSTPSGSMTFELDKSLDVAQFKSDVAAKRAKGKKVVLSLGGQDGTVSLATASDTENFVSSLTKIIKEYGFDGLDIDLESGAGILHGAPVQTNIVKAVKQIKANTLGAGFFLSMAPEHPYVQGGFTAYSGIWGAYLPIIDGLRDDLTILHVQLYNNGGLSSPYGTYNAASEDILVASAEMLLDGFKLGIGGNGNFAPLRPDQVAFGIPSGNTAANPGNFVNAATVKAAYNCIANGTECASRKPTKTYPAFRGVMTWSINWDKHDGPANLSEPLGTFLRSQP